MKKFFMAMIATIMFALPVKAEGPVAAYDEWLVARLSTETCAIMTLVDGDVITFEEKGDIVLVTVSPKGNLDEINTILIYTPVSDIYYELSVFDRVGLKAYGAIGDVKWKDFVNSHVFIVALPEKQRYYTVPTKGMVGAIMHMKSCNSNDPKQPV